MVVSVVNICEKIDHVIMAVHYTKPLLTINNIPAVVQIMAWRQPGDKPLSEPMMVSLLMHISVTRPQLTYNIFIYTVLCRAYTVLASLFQNSLRPSDTIWLLQSRSTLAQVPDGIKPLPEPVIGEVLWHSPEGNFTGNAPDIYT